MTASRDRARDRIHADVPRVAWSVKEFAVAMGVSLDTVYREIKADRLEWFKLGGEYRIPDTERERLLAEAAAKRQAVAS